MLPIQIVNKEAAPASAAWYAGYAEITKSHSDRLALPKSATS